MKLIILILAIFTLVPNLPAQEEGYGWVVKHYNEDELEDAMNMECINDSVCYAFTNYGGTNRIYQTIDEGRSWAVIYERDHSPSDPNIPHDSVWNLSYCDVVGNSHFYMTYSKGNVIDWSHDGAKTFNRTTFDVDSWDVITELIMYDSLVGFAMLTYSTAVTKDGWKTYTYYDWDGTPNITDPTYFLDSTTVAIQKLRINGGYSFLQMDINTGEMTELFNDGFPNDSSRQHRIKDCYFVDDSIGYATGSKSVKMPNGNFSYIQSILKTKDSGRSWAIIYEADEPFYLGAQRVAFKDEMNGFAIGRDWLLWTDDGGVSWERQSYMTPGLSGGLAYIGDYAGDTPIIAHRRFHRYEKADEDLNAMYFTKVIDESFCPQKDSVRLEPIIKIEDGIVISDFFFSGEGVTRHFEDNDPDHPLTGFYFHPNLVGSGEHEVSVRAFNRGLYGPKLIREDSTFTLTVLPQDAKPSITRNGNTLSTQYPEVSWYRAEWELWIKNNKAYTPIGNQSIYAEYTNGEGCVERSDVYDFILTSVDDDSKTQGMIYSGNTISFQMKGKDFVKIYNSSGVQVYQNSDLDNINVENWSSGVYFVVFTNASGDRVVEKLSILN